jgi:16S rRNA (guanine527-N7)-methyltransferase
MPELTDLLRPFLTQPLSINQVKQVQDYLELLLKWNARISLTAIRAPNGIVERHFGESFFAGEQVSVNRASSLIDVGSGAGFPGLPMAILAPQTQTTLVESQQKKVAFLREAIRTLKLMNVNVYAGRAEELEIKSQIVTMRAVERFDTVLPVAASLVQPGGELVLLIGETQADTVQRALPKFAWRNPIFIPTSRHRIVLVGGRSD